MSSIKVNIAEGADISPELLPQIEAGLQAGLEGKALPQGAGVTLKSMEYQPAQYDGSLNHLKVLYAVGDHTYKADLIVPNGIESFRDFVEQGGFIGEGIAKQLIDKGLAQGQAPEASLCFRNLSETDKATLLEIAQGDHGVSVSGAEPGTVCFNGKGKEGNALTR